ncbi:VPEID-CTERM sorting domain-containing protein [Roseovarius sp. S4756]|uniref:VPEID-CTERM sorting domain-containing protein n=1 Tax=Roseovarius maritimus TaxID=3342637 RepID=UPI00372A2881
MDLKRFDPHVDTPLARNYGTIAPYCLHGQDISSLAARLFPIRAAKWKKCGANVQMLVSAIGVSWFRGVVMKSLYKIVPASAAFLMFSSVSASAQDRRSWFNNWLENILGQIGWGNQTPAHNVPEIDASSGLMAVAAVLAALLLTWEIRRRRG